MKKIICTLAILLLITNTADAEKANYTCNNPCTPSSTSSINTSAKSIENLVGNFDNKIDIVFSDIDGTIVKFDKDTQTPKMPESAKKAVKAMHKSKLPLVLTTGRVYVEANEIAKEIGNSNTYIITNQGAEIRNPKQELIYQDTISNSDAMQIINYADSIIKTNNFNSKIIAFVNGKLYSNQEVKLPYIWTKVNVINSFQELGTKTSVCEIMIYDMNPKDLKFVQTSLKNKFPSYHIDLSTHCFCDVTSSTATKGNAIKKLSEILGIDLKNAATLGDAENDISMLGLVKKSGGLSIAVGNAMDSVKSNANFITLPVNDGGFAKAVDEVLQNNLLLKKEKTLKNNK